jgi:hypothetical protein
LPFSKSPSLNLTCGWRCHNHGAELRICWPNPRPLRRRSISTRISPCAVLSGVDHLLFLTSLLIVSPLRAIARRWSLF